MMAQPDPLADAPKRSGLSLTIDGPRLPLRAVVSKQAILGMSGSGKTQTARKLAEAMMDARQHVVIFDPTGAWWGLRSSADGESAGYPIVVFGGDHADAPLRPDAGAVLARAVMERRFNAIFDLSGFHEAEMRRCQTDFLNTLNRLNRQPVHVIFDEFDITCPQAKTAGSEESRAAVNTTVRRGRIRGIGSTMVTQNPQDADKSALNMADTVIVMRTAGSQSIDAIENWVKRNGSKEQMQQMTATLPSLETGSGWIWSPQIPLFELVRFQLCWTYDSSKTPEIGETIVAPKVLAPVDLKALGKEIAKQVREEQDASVPHLRERIKELEAELKAATEAGRRENQEGERVMGLMEDVARIEREAEEARAELAAGSAALATATAAADRVPELERQIERLHDFVERLAELMLQRPARQADMPSEAPRVIAIEPKPAAAASPSEEGTSAERVLNEPRRKILNALATIKASPIPANDGLVAVLAGTTARARGYLENLRALRNAGLITRDGGALALTSAGSVYAQADLTPRTFDGVLSRIAKHLNGPQREMLHLIHRGVSQPQDLASAMNTTMRSRGYEDNVRALLKMGYVDRVDGGYKPAAWLQELR